MASEAWLEEMSQAIVTVTKGSDKPDRRYAYDFLRNHVKVDELHQLAIRKFKGKTIELGEGSLNPEVVVVTKDPITKEQKAKLILLWKKLEIPPDEVYYTHLRFVKTKQKQAERQKILDGLVNTLKPRYAVVFDGVEIEYEPVGYRTEDSVEFIADPAEAAKRKQLMGALRNMD